MICYGASKKITRCSPSCGHSGQWKNQRHENRWASSHVRVIRFCEAVMAPPPPVGFLRSSGFCPAIEFQRTYVDHKL
jgi:hypothetical protein